MWPCHAAAWPVAQTVGSAMAKAHPRNGACCGWQLAFSPCKSAGTQAMGGNLVAGQKYGRLAVPCACLFEWAAKAVLPCETGRMAMQYRPFGSVIRPVFPTGCGTVGWARRCNCRQPCPRPNARQWGLMPLASLWRWHQGRNTAPVRPCGHRHLFIIYRQLPTTACIHLP